jgi:hypothetical protein
MSADLNPTMMDPKITVAANKEAVTVSFSDARTGATTGSFAVSRGCALELAEDLVGMIANDSQNC